MLPLPTVSSPIVWISSPSGDRNLMDLLAESATITLPAGSIQNAEGSLTSGIRPKVELKNQIITDNKNTVLLRISAGSIKIALI